MFGGKRGMRWRYDAVDVPGMSPVSISISPTILTPGGRPPEAACSITSAPR